jgi:replicative DNA helicase
MSTIAGLANEIWRDIKKRHDTNPGGITGLSTGFRKLDDLIDGLRPETLTIIGARPKQGKTSLLQAIIANMAKSGLMCCFFSLEMPKTDVISRFIAMEADVNHQFMARGVYTEEERDRIEVAAAEIDGWPLIIDDTTGLTPAEFAKRAKRAINEDGAQAVFLDYLQKMQPDKAASGRYEKVTEISMAVADARKEIKIPIVAAAQLNRKVVDRSTRSFSSLLKCIEEITRPNDGDLRDSGQIEQDADALIFLNRPIVVLETMKPTGEASSSEMIEWEAACSKYRKRAELNVHYNRAGPSGFVNLLFEGAQMLFREPPH